MHDDPSPGDGPDSPSGATEAGASPDASAVVEQVRELLFGDHRRATENALKSLEERLAATTAAMESRLSDLERKLEALKPASDTAHGAQALGAALVELGERLRADLGKPESHKPGGKT